MKIIMTRNIQNKLESNNSKEEEEEEEDAFSPENKKVSMKNADKYNYNYYYYYDDDENDDDDDDGDDDDEVEGLNTKSDEVDAFKHDDADDGDDEDDSEREKGKENVKRKREIRDYESSVERDVKSLVNETENKSLAREKSSSEKSSIEKSSAEFHSSLEKSSEWTSKEKFIPSTYRLSRKSHPHRKHRKSR